MAVFVVTHKVNDFAAWKGAYDSFNSKQVEHGIKDHYVLQSVDDPNNVLVVAEGELGKIQEFLNSEELKNVMAKAGVGGTPTIFVGENRI